MRKELVPLFSVVFLFFSWEKTNSQLTWLTFKGPVGHEYDRMGTDGTSLYIITNGKELWRYSFSPGAPNLGTWKRLKDAPRIVNAWDSYRGLAFQAGYFYTSAIPSKGGGRTIIRYKIRTDTWEVWKDARGNDLRISNTSGNGMFMEPLPTPSNLGKGYSVWHAGYYWVSFDWNKKAANNKWMSTASLNVKDAAWVSRNESITWNGNPMAPVYYSTHNDWTKGLSGGDVIYKFDLKTKKPAVVAKKPWEAGFGQCVQFIPRGHALNTSNEDELWLFRGGDCAASPHEGWSKAGTKDFAIFRLKSKKWSPTLKTPEYMGYDTDSVVIGNCLFLKSAGSSKRPDEHNDIYMVLVSGAYTKVFGKGCKASNGIIPLIVANGAPYIGNSNFAIGISKGLPSVPGLLILGLSATSWNGIPLPLDLTPYGGKGCFLNVSFFEQFLSNLSQNGSLWVPQPIPNSPVFSNISVYYQWLMLDMNNSNPLKAVFTQGAEVHIL